jgi:hypothetical protein
MKPSRQVVLAVRTGLVMGSVGTMLAYYTANRTTLVLTARQGLVLDEGITIPKGTQLVHRASFPRVSTPWHCMSMCSHQTSTDTSTAGRKTSRF